MKNLFYCSFSINYPGLRIHLRSLKEDGNQPVKILKYVFNNKLPNQAHTMQHKLPFKSHYQA